MIRAGVADLPLHYGRAPRWLFARMKDLAREVIFYMVLEFGPRQTLARLSDPFWFQAFGCLLGFDWHSSGLTTTVCAAIKEGLKGCEEEIGLFAAGGKGARSRRTPGEIVAAAARLSVSCEDLVYASRLTAKVDSSALQDGYQIYHHSFFFTAGGDWCVIQQGMNPDTRFARRYHWLSSELDDFVCEPHRAILSQHCGKTLNLVAQESGGAREVCTRIARTEPEESIAELEDVQRLVLPSHHYVDKTSFNPKRIRKILLTTYEKQPKNFEDLLITRGVGPATLRAFALLSELVYGEPPSFRDPARYSFAHGGKDGHPYPVDRETYSHTIELLKEAILSAKLGNTQKMKAIRRLERL